MKTVSAAKLRRAQERVFSARPYAEWIERSAKMRFQGLQLVRKRGLGQIQALRCLGQAAGVGQGDQRFQVTQLEGAGVHELFYLCL